MVSLYQALTKLNQETRTHCPSAPPSNRVFSTLPVELLAACHFHGEQAVANLTLKSAADFLRDQNHLAEWVKRRTREVQVVQDVTIMAMASLAETRDNETGNHIRRTQNYVRALAGELRTSAMFATSLTTHHRTAVQVGAAA